MTKTILSILFYIFFAELAWGFTAAKFEPPNGQVYHGAQAEIRPASIFSYHVDWKGIEKYAKAAGKMPKLITHYFSIDPIAFRLIKPAIREIGQRRYSYIPQIGLDFFPSPSLTF